MGRGESSMVPRYNTLSPISKAPIASPMTTLTGGGSNPRRLRPLTFSSRTLGRALPSTPWSEVREDLSLLRRREPRDEVLRRSRSSSPSESDCASSASPRIAESTTTGKLSVTRASWRVRRSRPRTSKYDSWRRLCWISYILMSSNRMMRTYFLPTAHDFE